MHELQCEWDFDDLNFAHRQAEDAVDDILACALQDTEAKLAASNMKVATLSGDMGKEQRQKILTMFRNGAYRALVVSGRQLGCMHGPASCQIFFA